jgi:hypothetical protein
MQTPTFAGPIGLTKSQPYKINPANCDTPHQTHCVGNSIFLHFVMVMTMLWAELWFVVAYQALFFFDGEVENIAVEISRAGPTTTVIFSCILDICGAFAACSTVPYIFSSQHKYVCVCESQKHILWFVSCEIGPCQHTS